MKDPRFSLSKDNINIINDVHITLNIVASKGLTYIGDNYYTPPRDDLISILLQAEQWPKTVL